MNAERTLAQELEIIRRHLIGMWTITDTKAAAVHIESAINQLHSKSAAIERLRTQIQSAEKHLMRAFDLQAEFDTPDLFQCVAGDYEQEISWAHDALRAALGAPTEADDA